MSSPSNEAPEGLKGPGDLVADRRIVSPDEAGATMLADRQRGDAVLREAAVVNANNTLAGISERTLAEVVKVYGPTRGKILRIALDAMAQLSTEELVDLLKRNPAFQTRLESAQNSLGITESPYKELGRSLTAAENAGAIEVTVKEISRRAEGATDPKQNDWRI